MDFFLIDKYLLAISMIFRILMRIRWVVYCPSSLLLDGLHKNFKRYRFFWGIEPPSPDKNMELCTTISQYREKAPISAAGSSGFSEKINFNDNSHSIVNQYPFYQFIRNKLLQRTCMFCLLYCPLDNHDKSLVQVLNTHGPLINPRSIIFLWLHACGCI